MGYSDKITALKGVGEKTAKLFHKLSVDTIGDLLYCFPRDYQLFGEPVLSKEAPLEETVTLKLTVLSPFQWKKVRQLIIGTGILADSSGKVRVTCFNTPYLKNILKNGESYYVRGRLKKEGNGLHMDQPQFFSEAEYQKKTGSLQPLYGLTKGLTNNAVMKAMQQAVNQIWEEEYLPPGLLSEYQLLERKQAINQIHFPKDYEEMLAARKRLAFDEFFLFLISLRRLKEQNEGQNTRYPMIETADAKRLIEQLPYKLTGAQKRVWEEIKGDLTGGKVMNRLVQGDVGSGKTVLAFLALVTAVSNGYQGALMAPTEILAVQHYEQLKQLAENAHLPLKPLLLTGSLTAAERRRAYEKIETQEANVIVGTHALIQEKVTYKKLALVITDEQHRFGVKQREALSNKGGQAHVLVMSATPIPRTLAIILYGDLHLSAVDELPAERLPIKNCVVNTDYRQRAYRFIEKEVEKGHQAYVICPMVEESENTEGLENVTDYTKSLKNELPSHIQVACLHGKMKPAEKNRIMEEFGEGNIDVLVSTTVIEVGINVPNATVMMVENAERFGLAQLHQLRGRIGRGKAQSYCIFMNGSEKKGSMERLQVLNKSNDGFFIAEEDLKLRGPGDLFGIRQSGALAFRVADIYQDSGLLKKISATVEDILQEDPALTSEKYASIQRYLTQNSNPNAVNFIDFGTI